MFWGVSRWDRFCCPGFFLPPQNVSVVKPDLNHPNFRPKSHPLAGPAASLPLPAVHEPELGFLLLGPSRDSPPAFRERGQDPKGGSGRGSQDRAGLRSRERLLLDVGSEVSEGTLQGQEELRALRKAIPGSVCQKSRFSLVFPCDPHPASSRDLPPRPQIHPFFLFLANTKRWKMDPINLSCDLNPPGFVPSTWKLKPLQPFLHYLGPALKLILEL